MNCVIVDDEKLSRTIVEKFVQDTSSLNLVGSYSKGSELHKALNSKQVDLIFLDINMPEINGIDLVKTTENIPQVIFITSHTDYAIEAFEHDVTDYLVKPIKFQRFLKSVDRAEKIHNAFRIEETDKNTIYVKSDSRLIKIDLTKLTYIEALGDYVRIHSKHGKYTVLSTMKAMDLKLPDDQFMRVHKSYIVRIDKIQKVIKSEVHLEGYTVPVSRSYKDALKERLPLL
ncbi:MAG: LytTR family DNA-binding domain-containing protein [Salibacteraceae bacterium]|nr:LytTR family DNA-binding domain-containing protein [Salibacteraceae bacterium]|tara:strand:+ start:1779 stop:2465 length:687 start_codon:yes stop_codon:yes gene_type:complete